MAPLQAKAFALALQENIQKYEARFGEIQLTQEEWLKELGLKAPGDLPN